MERSGNFYKAIQLGYILISILIGCMAYNSLYEWQEIEALELGNKKIDELRKEINNINIQMIKFSLLGETILEWNDKDIEHYHARRMAMDSMLCRFKATYPAERIDSVRSLLEDKERQMFQIVRLMDEQQSINKKIANQIPVIVQKSVQEQSKKPKRKGFLGIFGKKEGTKPTTTTTTLRSSNRNMVNEQKAQSRRLSEQADSLAARNAELNRQLQGLICQIEKKVQSDLQNRESEITAMRKKSFMQIGGLMGFVLLLLVISYIIIHRDAKNIKRYKRKTTDLIEQLEQSVQQNEVLITNRNKFVLGPSGSGKSFFMNHLVRQYYEQGAHVVLVDTGNSYQGLCGMIRRKTGGADGVYFTYTEEKPISFNPFYTDDYIFDVEKKDSIKTLLLTLWKSEDDKVTKTESGELGSAVSAYIERIQSDRSIVPSFNTFYEYMRDDYRKELAQRDIKVEKSDFNIDNMLTTMRQYYRGGRYDFLLNSTENIDLLGKRFIVFEIDSIKENRELFPVVTIIIMEAFINKMRRLKGVRKQLIVEEAWKALSSANMAEYLRYMYKTVRKYYGEAIVVTQEVDDIISSPVVKESIINNSDCKILLDQRKYMNKFDQIQALLGLTEKEKGQILSINMANNPSRLYKEVWIGLGGTQSAVYATEVSAEEYLAYTTEETEKVEVYRLAEKLGGDIEAAIRQLAEKRRTKS